MRQKLGPKKVARLRAKTGLDIVYALVRGNTGHRIDLYVAGGRIVSLWPDGSTEESEERRWAPKENQPNG
jgi:hypothetical protein